ncbi:hypothetical protein CP533_2310 [Ophiocordyceps camponoti-saundersi (nom. inval.)]|nr:hypothetical protein CP533_2310 [Ophiocordyceps camponoti-saundersi (nom. inval.)]
MIKSLVLLAATATQALSCSPFPCPASYGSCNKCIQHSGRTFALSRSLCGDYSESKCQRVYSGGSGLCADGCNLCICTAHGLATTEKRCLAYNYGECVRRRGLGLWDCGNGKCTCTECGIGFAV